MASVWLNQNDVSSSSSVSGISASFVISAFLSWDILFPLCPYYNFFLLLAHPPLSRKLMFYYSVVEIQPCLFHTLCSLRWSHSAKRNNLFIFENNSYILCPTQTHPLNSRSINPNNAWNFHLNIIKDTRKRESQKSHW